MKSYFNETGRLETQVIVNEIALNKTDSLIGDIAESTINDVKELFLSNRSDLAFEASHFLLNAGLYDTDAWQGEDTYAVILNMFIDMYETATTQEFRESNFGKCSELDCLTVSSSSATQDFLRRIRPDFEPTAVLHALNPLTPLESAKEIITSWVEAENWTLWWLSEFDGFGRINTNLHFQHVITKLAQPISVDLVFWLITQYENVWNKNEPLEGLLEPYLD